MVTSRAFTSLFGDDTFPVEDRLAPVLAAFLAGALFWSTACSELAAVGIVVAAIARLIRSKGKAFSLPRTFPAILVSVAFILLGVYVIGELLSAVFSPFPAKLPPFLHLWHVLLFPAFFILQFRADAVRRCGTVFVLSGSLAALATIIGYLAGTAPHLNALFLGNTTFADLLVLCSLLLFGSIIAMPALRVIPWKGWQLFLLAIPPVVGAFLSALRAPVAALVGAVLALTLLHRPRAVLVQAAVFGALIMISPLELWLKFAWLAEGHTVDRYVVWKAGVDLLPQTPVFGFGPEAYAHILPPGVWATFSNRAPASWHNDFLGIVLGSGWHTVIAYAACIALMVACGLSTWTFRRPSREASVAGMLACLLSTLVFFSLFSSVVSTAVLGIVLWSLLGFLGSTIAEIYRA